MKPRVFKSIILILVFLMLFGDVPGPSLPPAYAQASPVNAVVALFNIIGAARRRNRVYREARATQREMDAYYDDLLDEARSQLQERGLMGQGTQGEFTLENRGQLRVYIKMYEALQAERAAVTQQIENEKNDARRQFNRSLTNEIVGILVKSPGGQRLIGDMRSTLGELRQAVEAVQEAIQNNRPFDALVGVLQEKLEKVPVIRHAAQEIGSVVAQKIDRLLGGVITRMENAIDNVQGEMGQVLDQVNQLDAELARVDERERTPVSLVEEGGVLSNIRGVDRANAVADVAAQAYTNAAIIAGALKNPSEAEKGRMRDRIREQLLGDRLDRLSSFGDRARFVDCEGVGQAAYVAAMNQLGRTPEQPADPSTSAYLVCKDKETGTIVHAALIGPALGASATMTAEALAEEQGEATVTPQGQPSPLEERCDLAGNGDFVIENYQVSVTSNSCEDPLYAPGWPADPLLVYLAVAGTWVEVDSSSMGREWSWQTSEDLEGAVVSATANTYGSALEIDISIDIPPSGTSLMPSPTRGHGYALAVLLPLIPLAGRLSSSKRSRIIRVVLMIVAFLLMAQSCDAYGSVSGSYSFPLPDDGFACEVPAENPNLAEMPGSSGQVSIELTIADDEGNAETCGTSANVLGIGILKRDGFYTEEMFDE
jgi:archaellum component FlaC